MSWLLLLLYLVPVFVVVYLLDAYEREPLSLVLGALLWGAVAATSLAGLANHDWGAVVARLLGPDVASRWTAALTAPLVEETLKALGVVLIYLIARSEINGVVDGFVYGAMVGLGFAVVENVFYFVGQFGGQPVGVVGGFFVRVLASGLYGHDRRRRRVTGWYRVSDPNRGDHLAMAAAEMEQRWPEATGPEQRC